MRFRAYPYLSGGSNIAIEVVLREIERRQEHCLKYNVKMPRVFFLQIDGGPENTSKVFYSFCEQLVRDGKFLVISCCSIYI